MADSTTTPTTEDTTQTGTADPSGKATEPKTFTQEQVDKIVQERLKRAKSEKPADYDELKAKAAKLDEIEDAQKTELERITEQATKAQETAKDWQAKFEQLQAQRQHELDVRNAATTYGVDADVLMRMGGDVDENARFLQGKEAARPKFGDMHDGGEQAAPTESLEERLKNAKNQQERIRIRAEFNARKRNGKQ
jgi:cytochrome c556